LSTLAGAAPYAIRNAQDYGMILGQRSYSKTYELQADALCTLIAANAGYDPLRGVAFHPDPGPWRCVSGHSPAQSSADKDCP